MSQNIRSRSNENDRTKYSDKEFLDALQHLDGSAATSEIASIVGCTRRLADNRLRRLATVGQVEKEKVGSSLLWRYDAGTNSVNSVSGYFSNYMSSNQASRVNPRKGIVITIRKPHSQAILNEEKNIEFRRTRIESSDIPSLGFVYEPAPTKAIVSVFQVDSIEQHSVNYLCEIGPANTPSTEESLREYFSGKDTGTAIFIDNVHPIDPPIPLKKNQQGDWIFNPPQDFYYVDPVDFVQKIKNNYEKPDNPGGESHELGDFLNTS